MVNRKHGVVFSQKNNVFGARREQKKLWLMENRTSNICSQGGLLGNNSQKQTKTWEFHGDTMIQLLATP